MRTIVITINISEELQQQTIKSTLQEQIAFHLQEKEKAKEMKKMLGAECYNLIDKVREQLNEYVGEEVWHKDRHSQNKIGFRDGRYKNTPYNDWDITATYTVKEVKYGQIRYDVPILEKGIALTLKPTEENQKDWKSKENQKSYVITDLDVVHRHLEKDYLTYFTNKL